VEIPLVVRLLKLVALAVLVVALIQVAVLGQVEQETKADSVQLKVLLEVLPQVVVVQAVEVPVQLALLQLAESVQRAALVIVHFLVGV
jgi:hypothetical protein